MKSRTCGHFVTLTTLKRGRPNINLQGAEAPRLGPMEINRTWCEAKKAAQDRQKWKTTVDALCPP